MARPYRTSSIRGGEAKALPYLLGQLNLLLHGVHVPRIDWGNALSATGSRRWVRISEWT